MTYRTEGRNVSHLFAAQNRDAAQNSNGSLHFFGKTLYSYREPIAHFTEQGDVLLSADNFSTTTSKHQSWARIALRLSGYVSQGRHNWARRRYDIWFTGPDGKPWHGVQYGDMTQICHCRRLKGGRA